METSERLVYLTSNLYITNEESRIIDCLIDHSEMPENFGQSHVRSFYSREDFHLVLYFPQEDDKGFQMYVVEDFSVNIDDLLFLRLLFHQLMAENDGFDLFKKAYFRVDTVLHMARTLRAVIHTDESGLIED